MNKRRTERDRDKDIPNAETRAAMAEADEYIAAWKKRMEQE